MQHEYVLYGRVSSEDQRERATIRTQLDAAALWASAHGGRISEHYLDDGVSGFLVPFAERGAGQRLLSDARAGKLKTVLVYDYTRLGRDEIDTLVTLRLLERLGVHVLAITQELPTDEDGASNLMRTVFVAFGAYERARIVKRSRDGMERGAREGRWMGGRPPFGYRVLEAKLTPHEAQAEIVREIFALYLSGVRLRPLADILNARGVAHPMGWHNPKLNRPWYSATVQAVLRNPVYVGRWEWRNRRTKTSRTENSPVEGISAQVPAIVAVEDFATVQSRLSEKCFPARNLERFYLLRGLVRCGLCGENYYSVYTGKTGALHPYYRCRSHVAHVTGKGACGNVGVWADFLDARVWAYCEEFLRDPGAALEAEAARLAVEAATVTIIATTASPKAILKRTRAALAGKERERERIINLHVRGSLDADETDSRLERLKIEIATLTEELGAQRVTARGRDSKQDAGWPSSMEAALTDLRERTLSLDDAARREVVLALVREVIVSSPAEGEQKHPTIKVLFSLDDPQGVHPAENGIPVSIFNLNSVNSTTALEVALAALQNLRPDPSRTQVEQLVSAGNSFYHGLTLELRRRFTHSENGAGFSFRAAYTLSRLIDDGVVNTSSALRVGDFRGERARSLLDRRHRFVFSGTFDAPRRLGAVRFGSIVRVASGAPFHLSVGGVDRNLDDVSNDRPVFNGDFSLLHYRKPGEQLDSRILAALSLPTIGQTGNLPRNAGRGPGLFTFDLNVTREFRLGEHARLRPVVEVDNVLNKNVYTFGAEFINFNALNASATDEQRQSFRDSFLVPTRTLRPRMMRVGLRFDF